MTVEHTGVINIARAPDDILAFVSDLAQYARADWKIGRIYFQRRDQDRILMRHGGWLRGLPGPPVTLEMRIDPSRAATYRSVPTFPSRWVLTFDGGFTCEPLPDGTTRVTHTERFHFHFPFSLVMEPFLREWLRADVDAEMIRLKALLEQHDAPGPRAQ